MLAEVRLAAHVLGAAELPAIATIFFGGGTPTLLPAEHLGVIIAELRDRFGLADDIEITTEANPETVKQRPEHTLPNQRLRIGCEELHSDLGFLFGRIYFRA